MKPLYQYAMTIPVLKTEWEKSNFSVDRLQAECMVFKDVILEQFPRESEADICSVHQFLLKSYSAVAPILIGLYQVAITCGYASARIE